MKSIALLAILSAVVIATSSPTQAQPWLDFPTENRLLLDGKPEEFFMYVDRNFQGVQSKPWQGGDYGFTRGPQLLQGEVVMTHLHEGIDIKPLRRTADGTPLDPVTAAAAGTVVHVSNDARASNYGKYVVVEHLIGGSPYYTLYAHLQSIDVQPGQRVRQGEKIGVLGFTGVGLNKERSHLHFEFCVMLNRNFQGWYDLVTKPGDPNRHGIYNGRNLVGANPADLLLAVQKQPNLDIRRFLSSLPPLFAITVNNSPNLDLLQLYPWMVPVGSPANPPAWKIFFSETGVPIRAEAVPRTVTQPEVTWLKPSPIALTHLSRGLITGTPAAPRLTESGQRFVRLLTFPD